MTLHPPLEIAVEMVGDVAVVRVSGRLTIDEPSEHFNEEVRKLVLSGQRKILIHLADVPQIDSSGASALVKSSVLLARQGEFGALKLVVPPGRVRDALTVNRLVDAIPTFDSVGQGVGAFAVRLFYCFCPLCGSRSDPPLDVQARDCSMYTQTCSSCYAQFSVATESQPPEVHLQYLRSFLYEGSKDEFIEVLVGPPVMLNLVGRLDLFTSVALENALRAIPTPRRALIDITEASDRGLEAVFVILRKLDANDGVVVLLEGLSPDRVQSLSKRSESFHSSRAAALAKLDQLEKTSRWAVRIERLT